ncbi:MAG: RNA polymerase sigma factor [Rhodothermales bacterium]|nr:RNA polymerase sigma factor [Rhodothermales bacterium]
MPEAATLTDEVLLDRSRGGDAGAFRILVERYEGRVAATVISMLGRTPEADDVGQETFIRFYNSIDRFRGDSTLATYLTRIAVNQSLKALKKRKNWSKRFFSRDENEGFDEVVDGGYGDVATELDERERKELVQQSLLRLSDNQRAVVVLRMLEGYSTKETAEMLGIAEGTVMSRLSRAMGNLATILRPLI